MRDDVLELVYPTRTPARRLYVPAASGRFLGHSSAQRSPNINIVVIDPSRVERVAGVHPSLQLVGLSGPSIAIDRCVGVQVQIRGKPDITPSLQAHLMHMCKLSRTAFSADRPRMQDGFYNGS